MFVHLERVFIGCFVLCVPRVRLRKSANSRRQYLAGRGRAKELQTLGANIWPGVDALKTCCTCGRLLESAREHVMESIRNANTKVYGTREHVMESIRKTTKPKACTAERLVARCLLCQVYSL